MIELSCTEQIEKVKTAFKERFGSEPSHIVRAPGRVNLIGEHTDYTGGFVFPTAIDREMIIAARHFDGEAITAYSLEYGNEDSFEPGQIAKQEESSKLWSNYLRAVVHVLQSKSHKVKAFQAVLSGNVPQGAGLSSSAAFEVAAVTLLNSMFGLSIARRDVALLSQRAENEFVGVQCGIMDQFISALGEPDSALLIDCRSLEYRAVPLDLTSHDLSLIIINSGVQRGLVDSEYNARRRECEEGAKLLGAALKKSVSNLRDVSMNELVSCQSTLPPIIARRCRHVVFENQRVLDAVAALERQDIAQFGQLMNQSHQSLRDDYEVSCGELDTMVSLLQTCEGVLGSRMTGAGFGGCTVSLMKSDHLALLDTKVLPAYEEKTGRHPQKYICKASAGASIIVQAGT